MPVHTKCHRGVTPTLPLQRPEPVDFSFNPLADPRFQFWDPSLLEAVKLGDLHVHEFFRLLSLCHTVMSEEKSEGRCGAGSTPVGHKTLSLRPVLSAGELLYKAQSPDEGALVTAARNFGFVFRSRTPKTITVHELGQAITYQLLAILDFNNIRKRMSVIGEVLCTAQGLGRPRGAAAWGSLWCVGGPVQR